MAQVVVMPQLGNTVESWLSALHTADVFGRWYQWFVALLGLVITMFSATGVYLWWKKRRVRIARRRCAAPQRRHNAAGVTNEEVS